MWPVCGAELCSVAEDDKDDSDETNSSIIGSITATSLHLADSLFSCGLGECLQPVTANSVPFLLFLRVFHNPVTVLTFSCFPVLLGGFHEPVQIDSRCLPPD